MSTEVLSGAALSHSSPISERNVQSIVNRHNSSSNSSSSNSNSNHGRKVTPSSNNIPNKLINKDTHNRPGTLHNLMNSSNQATPTSSQVTERPQATAAMGSQWRDMQQAQVQAHIASSKLMRTNKNRYRNRKNNSSKRSSSCSNSRNNSIKIM